MPVLSSGIVVSQNFYYFLNENSHVIIRMICFNSTFNKDVNYLDCHIEGDDVKISYLETKKFLGIFGRDTIEDEAFSEVYDKKRIYVNPGRILNKLFTKDSIEKYSIDNVMVEAFVYLVISYFGTQLEYKVVEGEDIRKYYFHKNYFQNIGPLGNSCMKWSECQSYLDIYVDNAKMLIGLVPGTDKISLRALLWDDVNVVNVDSKYKSKKVKMMDRIYYTYERYVPQAKKWAKENGFLHKEKQSVDCGVVDLDGEILEIDMYLNIKINKYKSFPFMDTFAYGYGKFLANYRNSKKDYILLRETNGSFE
jgi:hypothetical protein